MQCLFQEFVSGGGGESGACGIHVGLHGADHARLAYCHAGGERAKGFCHPNNQRH